MEEHKEKTSVKHQRVVRKSLFVLFCIVGVVSILSCAYGYAALSTDLMVSGEAMVSRSGVPTFGITYMQEMTSEVCDKAQVGTAQRLIDKRDGKLYWVEKMANDSCWMRQNLAYVITDEMIENNEINSDTSDLNYAETDPDLYPVITNIMGEEVYVWNNDSSYPPHATEVLPDISTPVTKVAADNRGTYSWFFGNEKGEDTFWMSLSTIKSCSSSKNIHTCANIADTGEYQAGEWSYAETGEIYDPVTKTFDPHYSIGVYYQFNTIVAGSGGNATNTQMVSSLCPKGWMLPLGTSADIGSNKSLYNLFTTYGYTTNQNGTYNDVTKNLAEDPMYMIRSGYVMASSTTPVSYVRDRAYLWTGYAGGQSQGVYARLSGASLARRSNDARYYGFPARCVAR